MFENLMNPLFISYLDTFFEAIQTNKQLPKYSDDYGIQTVRYTGYGIMAVDQESIKPTYE